MIESDCRCTNAAVADEVAHVDVDGGCGCKMTLDFCVALCGLAVAAELSPFSLSFVDFETCEKWNKNCF